MYKGIYKVIEDLQVALSSDRKKAIHELWEFKRDSLSDEFRVDSEFLVRSNAAGNGKILFGEFSSDEIVHDSDCIGDGSEDDHFRGCVLKLSLNHAELGLEIDEKLVDGSIDIDWVVSPASAAEYFSLQNIVFVNLLDNVG